MNTKIEYQTTNGKIFRTIAPIKPEQNLVDSFMFNNYNMAGIINTTS